MISHFFYVFYISTIYLFYYSYNKYGDYMEAYIDLSIIVYLFNIILSFIFYLISYFSLPFLLPQTMLRRRRRCSCRSLRRNLIP
mgnify:CR=1 FL=1